MLFKKKRYRYFISYIFRDGSGSCSCDLAYKLNTVENINKLEQGIIDANKENGFNQLTIVNIMKLK